MASTDRLAKLCFLLFVERVVYTVDPAWKPRQWPSGQFDAAWSAGPVVQTSEAPVLCGCDDSRGKRVAFDVPADDKEMFVTLDREAFEAALIKVPRSSGMVVSMMASRMSHRHPIQQSAHRPVFPGGQNHVPVIGHPLIGDQIDRVSLQTLVEHALKCLVIGVLAKNRRAPVVPIEA